MKINNDFEALVQVLTLAITAETEEQRNKIDPMAYEIAADFDELTIKRARKEALAKAEELIFKEALAKVEEQSAGYLDIDDEALNVQFPGAPYKCQLPVFFAYLGNPFKSDSLVDVSASGKADLEQLRKAASEALSESGYHGIFLERTEINGNFIQIIVGS